MDSLASERQLPHILSSLTVIALLLAAGCEPSSVEVGRVEDRGERVTVTAGDKVVAIVGDTPITASRVAALVKATGRPPREVVDQLIEFELLAAEARRRGLSGDSATLYAARQEMVQRYLELDFEATHRPEDMPEDMLRASYEKNIRLFSHPKLRKVAHILVRVEKQDERPIQGDKAQKLAQEIWRDARKAADREAFLEVGNSYKGRQGFKIIIEDISTPVYDRAPLDRAFIKAAMALEVPGEVSEPVRSSFGIHVIYLVDVLEEKNVPFEGAREQVLEKEHPFWIKGAFLDLTERLRLSTTVEGYVGPNQRGGTL